LISRKDGRDGVLNISRGFHETIGLRRGKPLEPLMAFGELQYREGLAIDALRRRKDLPKDSAAEADTESVRRSKPRHLL
jgi:hypothetical protein